MEETKALTMILKFLEKIEESARQRILVYVMHKFGQPAPEPVKSKDEH